MTKPLGGWTRLWIVLVTLTAVQIVYTGYKEYKHPQPSRYMSSGTYIVFGIPRGTSFSDNSVEFPDGRHFTVIQIDPKTGKTPEPWDIDWSKEPQIPKSRYVGWPSIFVNLLVIPLVVIFLLSIATKIVVWVINGFRQPVSS